MCYELHYVVGGPGGVAVTLSVPVTIPVRLHNLMTDEAR